MHHVTIHFQPRERFVAYRDSASRYANSASRYANSKRSQSNPFELRRGFTVNSTVHIAYMDVPVLRDLLGEAFPV